MASASMSVMAQSLASSDFCRQNLCPSNDECNSATRSECYERYRMGNGHVNTGLKCCSGQKNISNAIKKIEDEEQKFLRDTRILSWDICQKTLKDVIFTSIEKNRICYLYQNHCGGITVSGRRLANSCMNCVPNSPNSLGQVAEKCFEPYLAGAISSTEGEVFLPACCRRAP